MIETVAAGGGLRSPALAEHAAQSLALTLAQSRIQRLQSVLREHGIPMPEDDPRLGVSDLEHLLACRDVVRAAYELLSRLDDLRALVGSGAELLSDRSWRAE